MQLITIFNARRIPIIAQEIYRLLNVYFEGEIRTCFLSKRNGFFKKLLSDNESLFLDELSEYILNNYNYHYAPNDICEKVYALRALERNCRDYMYRSISSYFSIYRNSILSGSYDKYIRFIVNDSYHVTKIDVQWFEDSLDDEDDDFSFGSGPSLDIDTSYDLYS